MRLSRGFTLIELMITVAIVAILAGIALPQYNNYVRRGQATDGVAQLGAYRLRMETYFQDNRNYGTDPVCGVPAPISPRFTYSCVASNSGQAYAITATGSSGAVLGSTYRLDHTNQQSTSSFKGASVSKGCWLLRGDEC